MEKLKPIDKLLCAHYCFRAKHSDTYNNITKSFDLDNDHSDDFYDHINELLLNNNLDNLIGLEIYQDGDIYGVYLEENRDTLEQSIRRIHEAKISADVWVLLDRIIRQSMNHNIPWQKPETDYQKLLDNNLVLTK